MVPRDAIETPPRRPEHGARPLETALEQLPIAVVVVDAETGAVTAASERARSLLGDDALARPALSGPDGKPVPPDEHPVTRAFADGEPAENELYELVRSDGAARLVSVTATQVLGEHGEVLAVVAVYDDVTERTRRLRAEREFIANAAHELRTPLAAIAGAVEVLQAGAKELPRERDLFLSHVERETERLTRLARALLLLARAQSTAERPRATIVALRPLLDEVAATVRPAEGVTLSVRCAASLAAVTNRDLLEQALANLAQNAARHTAKGAIRLRARASDETAVIEVVDSGSGFSEDAQARAFDRFFRAGRDGEGYGLGLSIARQAIEVVEGTLELESGDRGTTARIRLPLARLMRS